MNGLGRSEDDREKKYFFKLLGIEPEIRVSVVADRYEIAKNEAWEEVNKVKTDLKKNNQIYLQNQREDLILEKVEVVKEDG